MESKVVDIIDRTSVAKVKEYDSSNVKECNGVGVMKGVLCGNRSSTVVDPRKSS